MPQPRTLCVTWRPSPSQKRGQSPPPNFRSISIVAKRLDGIKMPLGTEIGLDQGDIVRWGPSSPKKGHSPHVYCGQRAVCIRIPLVMEVDLRLSLGYIVRWGPSSLSPKGTQHSQFSANVRYGQTAGWTKIPLGMQVGLGRGDFVFDGDPALPRKKAQPLTQFLSHVYCGQTAGWSRCHLVRR